ncbi:gluconate 2-dehydrogenase subunit 3 family protein [Bradyrhizobium canariense]|uniref:Gluconate 2-dehydrogenase gamma chain n=1 Tax=Bradyrhizobium canariense TaxID=255045 RepID=A0A1H2AHL8_9BRAD|nr:gluconate 2-dehydrogenase subunit 3 family protein [Bradyrhizobium canariense]SDT45451.1 gluconate 2-dehydrogenase gamma chain [Bradyrhizobium canariense]
MAKGLSIDRRSLLLGAAPVATAVLSGLAGCSPRSGDGATAYAPTFFSADEWAFVRAAVGRLIPSEGPGPGGIEAGVPEFIDRQMEMPYGHGAYFYLAGPFLTDVPPSLGYQLRYAPREIYRLGIAAANVEARKTLGKTFAELPAGDQDRLLDGMEKNAVRFTTVPAPVFFGQLLANAKEGYFADPLYGGNRGMAAWKWIGFPGARADFTDWIDQAGRAYPYGPVAISGARG